MCGLEGRPRSGFPNQARGNEQLHLILKELNQRPDHLTGKCGEDPRAGEDHMPCHPTQRPGEPGTRDELFHKHGREPASEGGPYFTDRPVLHGSIRLREGPEQLRCGPPQDRQEAKPCPTQGRRHSGWAECGGSGQSRTALLGLGSTSLGQNLRKTRRRRESAF